MILKNVTRKVEFTKPINDRLPMTKCMCGAQFANGQFVISTSDPTTCPRCGQRFIWNGNIRVYEVK